MASSSAPYARDSFLLSIPPTLGGDGRSALPGKFLASQRRAGLVNLCDIEVVADGRREYVHAAVVAVHSSYLYKLINSRSPPLTLNLEGVLRMESLRSAFDWMYFETATFDSNDMDSHLAVASFLEIPELQLQLEYRLIGIASSATDPKRLSEVFNQVVSTKLTPPTISRIWHELGRRASVPELSPLLLSSIDCSLLREDTIICLLSRLTQDLRSKATFINIALQWLRLNKTVSPEMLLFRLKHTSLTLTTEHEFIEALVGVVKQKANSVHVALDNSSRYTIFVNGVPAQLFQIKDIVTAVESPDTRTYIGPGSAYAMSPVSSILERLKGIPDPFVAPRKYSASDRIQQGEIDTPYKSRLTRQFTASEIREINSAANQANQYLARDLNGIPDQFKKQRRSIMNDNDSEFPLPDQFDDQRLEPRVFSRCELSDLAAIPDQFKQPQRVRKFGVSEDLDSPGGKAMKEGPDFTPSEIRDFKRLPNLFNRSSAEKSSSDVNTALSIDRRRSSETVGELRRSPPMFEGSRPPQPSLNVEKPSDSAATAENGHPMLSNRSSPGPSNGSSSGSGNPVFKPSDYA